MYFTFLIFAVGLGSILYLWNKLPPKVFKINRMLPKQVKKNRAVTQDDGYCYETELRKTNPNAAKLN